MRRFAFHRIVILGIGAIQLLGGIERDPRTRGAPAGAETLFVQTEFTCLVTEELDRSHAVLERGRKGIRITAVSYTHLTLPTILRV